MSLVTAVPAASSPDAVRHFQLRLSVETDCADVHAALAGGAPDFVLLHAVGSPQAFARRHIPGAVHLPHCEITADSLARWSADTLFVTYCAGPHCNGADQAALKLALLGRPVKIMIGGMTGWQDEGFTFAQHE
ncbi:rhodanese-like domain-containing protein [Pluralibacter gergoviae]|uniref:rhodanese-like domain-containing protein n=1 Tax=Pluralibacter gergoviae TaxID=61647 RepID=UPI00290CCCE9|nr:rhodanese-like domain-containing protein [Pluralibacter gergoviae]MDU4001768.1 rhodanese-like domain-containing protein [Pluralibacter gergoviae]